MNGNHMETVTTVSGAVLMHHPSAAQQQQLQQGLNNQQQIQGHLQGVHQQHNILGNGIGHLSMTVQQQPRHNHHHHHHHNNSPQQQQQLHHVQSAANGNTILSMAANLIAGDLTSAPPPAMETNHGTVLVDPNGSLIHPALRGVKTVNIGKQ